MAESLSRKLAAEMNTSGLLRIRTSNSLKPINHALFVDYSLLLGGTLIRIAKSFDSVLKAIAKPQEL